MAEVAIVDDSKDTVELFQFILQDGHLFTPYTDPAAFLQDFRPGRFALILVDLAMPDMDGYQVFDRIRELDKVVPVCAITAHAFEKERERALRAGFCDYFVKPILEITKFREMVHSHIGKCANPDATSN